MQELKSGGGGECINWLFTYFQSLLIKHLLLFLPLHFPRLSHTELTLVTHLIFFFYSVWTLNILLINLFLPFEKSYPLSKYLNFWSKILNFLFSDCVYSKLFLCKQCCFIIWLLNGIRHLISFNKMKASKKLWTEGFTTFLKLSMCFI